MPELAARLRAYRTKLGLRQLDLADRSGISAAYLSQIESGQKRPSMDVLERLAVALGVTAADLLHPERDAPTAPSGNGAATPPTAPSTQATDDATGAATMPVVTYTITRREDVEQALRSHVACHAIAHRAEEVLASDFGERLGAHAQIGQWFAWVLYDYASGDYRAIPWESIVLIAAALLYLTEPDDFVPADHAEGHLDDVAILRFTESLVEGDMASYLAWRRGREAR